MFYPYYVIFCDKIIIHYNYDDFIILKLMKLKVMNFTSLYGHLHNYVQ